MNMEKQNKKAGILIAGLATSKEQLFEIAEIKKTYEYMDRIRFLAKIA